MNTEPEGTESRERQYAWVMNVWHLLGQDSFELATGHALRRATANERATIRDIMEKIPGGFFPHGRTIWQIQWPHEGGALVALPEEEWRYFVIEFEGQNDTLAKIQEAFDLGHLELEVGFTVLELGTVTYYPARFFHILEQLDPSRRGFFVDVSAADIASVREIREKLEKHDHGLLDLTRSIGQLRALKALQHQSPLRFLGYFGILESLLTHQPNPNDTIDSITRQVKKKVALLDHRWAPQLDYSPFNGALSETVWRAMYACRSRLAHGAEVNFGSADLRVLGSQDRALTFLVSTVKAVMRYALDEPRLLADLRDC